MGNVELRPHHLLCIQGFRGQGYSPGFIANMARLVETLEKNEGQSVHVAAKADDICAACPHLKGGDCVSPGQDVDSLDLRVLERLQLTDGQDATWKSLKESIAGRIAPDQIAQICSTCRWRDFDYCSKGIERLSEDQISSRSP